MGNFLEELMRMANLDRPGMGTINPPASDDEDELAPETRVVILNFPTEPQRSKAIERIRTTGQLKVRIQVD